MAEHLRTGTSVAAPAAADAAADAAAAVQADPFAAAAGPVAAVTAEPLSLVIPLYREAEHLGDTLPQIIGVLETLGRPWELVLVDDGSPDGTWRAIEQQCAANPAIRGLRLSRNFGKEAALAAGLEHARGNPVVLMDGDLQHPPALLPQMVQAWADGAEVVEAVKVYHGRHPGRRRANLFYSLFAALSGHDLHGASDFKLMDRRVLDAWRSLGEHNLFFRGMHAWLGFRRVQLPFEVPERAGGHSGWSLWSLLRLAITAVTSFSSVPLQLISLAGGAFALFALVMGAQTIYQKLSGHALDGFTTVILLLLVIGSVMMLGLGIIGTYIARIYDEVKARPRYIVAERR
jgi:polyisoprenyl-phosphate glycosyltransferase